MRPVLAAHANPECTSRGIEINNFTMVVHSMRNRPSWSHVAEQRGTKFIIVVVDYFTKWAEAEVMVTIIVPPLLGYKKRR